MASVYRVLRWVYHRAVPAGVRRLGVIDRASHWLVQRVATHDEIYSPSYYEEIDEIAAKSAGPIADSVVRAFGPARLIDVGCGTGAVLAALRDRGCAGTGLEYSEAGLAKCRARGLTVHKFDLEQDTSGPAERYELAISTEVAEHLPAAVADRYVGLLTALAPAVVFTAAPPGQGGTDHVNEQPPEYWVGKFAARGFRLDTPLTDEWKREWRDRGTDPTYHANLMVFRAATERG